MDFSDLNDYQKEAVFYNDGPTMVISSAGSGKTRCIINKIFYVVRELNVNPRRVWACTFTKKAALEMKDRLSKIDKGSSDLTLVNISTIHSLAFTLLKEGKKSIEPWYVAPKILINKGKVLSFLYKYLKDYNFQVKDAKEYLDFIDALKSQRKRPHDFLQDCIASNNINEEKFRLKEKCYYSFEESVFDIYIVYEKWKQRNNFMDFADILLDCYDMLVNTMYGNFVSRIQSKVEHLFIDEAQDTNGISFDILKIIGDKHKRICLVGDYRQSIYSFQNARLQNLFDFEKEYQPKKINLKINYRSTAHIVRNANNLISKSKELLDIEPSIPFRAAGEKIDVLVSESLADEGYNLLNLIKEIKETRKCEWRDITVLYRVHSQSREIEDHLVLNAIPYVIFSKTSFFKRKEIKDLICYLKLALYPEDADVKDMKRVANKPLRYISNKALEKIEDLSDGLDELPTTILSQLYEYDEFTEQEKKSLYSLDSSLSALRSFINLKDNATTQDALIFILDNLGYRDWAIKGEKIKEVDGDIEMNFESLIESAKKFSTPQIFLDFVKEVEKKEKMMKDENADAVKLMSIHASKGREFKYVIIAGICSRTFPFYKAVYEGNEEEERRVMYVALTRAQDKLWLSNVSHGYGAIYVNLSPYIFDMDLDTTRFISGDSSEFNHGFEDSKEIAKELRRIQYDSAAKRESKKYEQYNKW